MKFFQDTSEKFKLQVYIFLLCLEKIICFVLDKFDGYCFCYIEKKEKKSKISVK